MSTILFSEMVAKFPLGPIALIIFLVFVGELLLALEFFVIPGFGIGGILGAFLLLAAIGVAGMTYGVLWGVGVFFVCAILSLWGLLWGMKTNLIQKRFVLKTIQKKGRETQSADSLQLLGKTGICETNLRPAGIALIDNRRMDVVSQGGFVDKGASIVVTRIEGSALVVKNVAPQGIDVHE